MPKAIIVGASSGIGLALAKKLSKEGYELGLTARRLDLLLDLQEELKTKTYVKKIDVAHDSEAMIQVQSLIQEMGEVDLFILNAGVLYNNLELDWAKEKATIAINVMGFSAMANIAMKHLFLRGRGHLVGISSVSGIRGERSSPAYSASKAFVSNYLEGLRVKAFKEQKNISVTDIQPGWVDTDMAIGEDTFWMCSAEKAALLIYSAIERKRAQAYISSRWFLYAWFMKVLPRWLYDRMF